MDLNSQVAVSVVSWIFVMGDRGFPLGNCLFEHQTSVISFISFDRSFVVELLSCIRLLRPNGLYLPGSSFHGISQARILEWVAILFSRDRTRASCTAGRFFIVEPLGKPFDSFTACEFQKPYLYLLATISLEFWYANTD